MTAAMHCTQHVTMNYQMAAELIFDILVNNSCSHYGSPVADLLLFSTGHLYSFRIFTENHTLFYHKLATGKNNI